ncbi:MAG: hypothetical protein HYU74_04310, partial [Dechloromonas sp.]|nr:hypothetical protein [Dechloromonas sp.]
TRFSYDARGRMLTRTDAAGVTTSYTHDATGNQLSEVVYRTDEFGAQVKVEGTQKYDALNRVVMDTDALGHTAVTEYDPIGRVTARVDRRGFRTVTEYDELGQLSAMRYADGTHESYTYDAEGRRLTTTDRGGRVTSAEYDELGRRVRSVNADLTTRSTVFDLGGNVRAEIDERGNRTEYEYDAQNRRVLTRSAVGDESLVSFDAVGNRETATDGRGNVTTFEYDANRRQIATLFADGYRTRTVYDFGGRVVLRLDQRNVPTRYEYDGVGRLVAVVDALGGRTSYGYDELGNRVSQTDANNHTTRFGFDSKGRMVSRTLPLGQREAMEFDADGNQTAKVTFKGDRLEYNFDSNGRLVRKRVPGYSEYVLTYTATGQRESVVDYRGLTSYRYDSRDRLLRVDNPEGTFVSYTYDLAGNRASITSPSQTVGYTYCPDNRMEHVLEPGGGVFTYWYDRAGNQIGLSYPNGVNETRTYDVVNRLLTIDAVAPFGVVTTFHYSLDATGRRMAVHEHNSRFVEWSYDDVYRLVEETVIDPVAGDSHYDYGYDAVGNRLLEAAGDVLTPYFYDANDGLIGVGSSDYDVDANGNLVTIPDRPGSSYVWDSESRLAGLHDALDATTVAIGYDIDGIRVARTEGAEGVFFVNDNATRSPVPIAEIGSQPVARTFGLDGQLCETGTLDAARAYTHADAIGSLRRGTSQLRALWARSFGAFGYSVLAGNELGFSGEPFDSPVGAVYLRARHFHPRIARFLLPDPMIGSPERSLLTGFVAGRYVYAHSDPVNLSDPSGNETLIQQAFAFSVYAYLGALVDRQMRLALGSRYGLPLQLAVGMAIPGGSSARIGSLAGRQLAKALAQEAGAPIWKSAAGLRYTVGTLEDFGEHFIDDLSKPFHGVFHESPAKVVTRIDEAWQQISQGNYIQKVVRGSREEYLVQAEGIGRLGGQEGKAQLTAVAVDHMKIVVDRTGGTITVVTAFPLHWPY